MCFMWKQECNQEQGQGLITHLPLSLRDHITAHELQASWWPICQGAIFTLMHLVYTCTLSSSNFQLHIQVYEWLLSSIDTDAPNGKLVKAQYVSPHVGGLYLSCTAPKPDANYSKEIRQGKWSDVWWRFSTDDGWALLVCHCCCYCSSFYKDQSQLLPSGSETSQVLWCHLVNAWTRRTIRGQDDLREVGPPTPRKTLGK